MIGHTAGCGVASVGVSLNVRLPDFSSVFAAECHAFDLALDLLINGSIVISHDVVLIVTDSKSMLKYFRSGSVDVNSFYFWQKIIAIQQEVLLRVVWVPGHVGFQPNEMADQLAKAGTTKSLVDGDLPNSVHLPKFSVPREDKRTYSELRRNGLLALPPESYHLRVFVPCGRHTPFLHRSFEHFFIRLRLNRPVYTLLGVRLASFTGFCFHCPSTAFNADHFFFDCPLFYNEQKALIVSLKHALRRREITLDVILTCGGTIRHMLITAKCITSFLFNVVRKLR